MTARPAGVPRVSGRRVAAIGIGPNTATCSRTSPSTRSIKTSLASHNRAATAARLCDARDVLIDRVDGDVLEHVAVFGPMPMAATRRPLTRGTPAGRAVIECQTIHIHDVLPLLETEYSEAKARQQVTG